MSAVLPVVTLATLAVFLLVAQGLRGGGAIRLVAGGLVILTGMLLAAHDAVNLPEMVGMLVIALCLGHVAVRHAAMATLPTRLCLFQALAGAALLLVVAAMVRNPVAFDIMDARQEALRGVAAAALGLCAVAGIALVVAGLAAWRRPHLTGRMTPLLIGISGLGTAIIAALLHEAIVIAPAALGGGWGCARWWIARGLPAADRGVPGD